MMNLIILENKKQRLKWIGKQACKGLEEQKDGKYRNKRLNLKKIKNITDIIINTILICMTKDY